jgi:hypothetical protein
MRANHLGRDCDSISIGWRSVFSASSLLTARHCESPTARPYFRTRVFSKLFNPYGLPIVELRMLGSEVLRMIALAIANSC